MAGGRPQAQRCGNAHGDEHQRRGNARKRPLTIRSIVTEAQCERKALVKDRRGKGPGKCRFLNTTPEAIRRRGKRVASRKLRAATRTRSQDTRTGTRASCLPCCGKRPARCQCWRKQAPEENRLIVRKLNRKQLHIILQCVAQTDILTFRDTADMPAYRNQ